MDKYVVKITTGKCIKKKLFVNKFAKNIQQVFLEYNELICFMDLDNEHCESLLRFKQKAGIKYSRF